MGSVWEIGDKIGGLYEIRRILGGPGKSGMGIVYVCNYRFHQKDYALKTYQERFVLVEALTNSFHDEALLWMGLGCHPNIVRAFWVHNLDGRIYVVMEYIPADNSGRVTLTDHMVEDQPLPLLRTLIWGMQFCDGMTYAASRGLRVHRDVKPDNILITLEKTVKITDFGLAKAFDAVSSEREIAGTPCWMSPEHFDGASACTVRSDIYSFGVVLYQMAGGRLPFMASPKLGRSFIDEMRRLHEEASVPRLHSVLFPIIQKCLAKKPDDRLADFHELRDELAQIWKRSTDLQVPTCRIPEITSAREINQQGVAMKHLGRFDEALKHHDRAIEIDPTLPNAWNDKGVALWSLSLLDEALECFEKAISMDGEFVHARSNKAALLCSLGRIEEGLVCYDEAIAADPEFGLAWRGKGENLLGLGRYPEALECFDRAIKINRHDSWAWYYKALTVFSAAEHPQDARNMEAEECAVRALEENPYLLNARALLDAIRDKRRH